MSFYPDLPLLCRPSNYPVLNPAKMSDPIADAAQKHPAPEGLVYTYGTAGVSRLLCSRNTQLTENYSSVPKRKLALLAPFPRCDCSTPPLDADPPQRCPRLGPHTRWPNCRPPIASFEGQMDWCYDHSVPQPATRQWCEACRASGMFYK